MKSISRYELGNHPSVYTESSRSIDDIKAYLQEAAHNPGLQTPELETVGVQFSLFQTLQQTTEDIGTLYGKRPDAMKRDEGILTAEDLHNTLNQHFLFEESTVDFLQTLGEEVDDAADESDDAKSRNIITLHDAIGQQYSVEAFEAALRDTGMSIAASLALSKTVQTTVTRNLWGTVNYGRDLVHYAASRHIDVPDKIAKELYADWKQVAENNHITAGKTLQAGTTVIAKSLHLY